MGKRLKYRISRVIQSFNSCCSKDSSALPSNPVPSFLQFTPVKPHHPITLHCPPSPNNKPPRQQSSIKGHVSSAVNSFACGCRSRSSSTECLSVSDHTESPPTPEFHWEKEDNFHVVAKIFDDEYESPRQKIYNSSASGPTSCNDNDDDVDVLLPTPPPLNTEKKTRRARIKKKRTPPRLFSSEGYDVDDDMDVDEETETLVASSRSFSTDDSSSEYNLQLETVRETPFRRRAITRRKKKVTSKKVKNPKRYVLKTSNNNNNNNNGGAGGRVSSDPEIDTPARLSMFLKRLMPCAIEGKVRDSFAVVKKSEDPYEDFKGSMLEMILEKQMFEEKDLEQLLQCFLSLNSRQHHGAIVQAFSEIWDALFYRRSTSFKLSTSQ